MDCGHFVHKNCFSQYVQQGNYKCTYCKKSIGNLIEHWEFIREQIKLHPLPRDLFPINKTDIVDSDYGKFKVLEINYIDILQPMYLGEFIDWRISCKEKSLDSSYAYGTLNINSVKKNVYKQIHCNDCGQKSSSLFHFYGLECGLCGSFNTQE